MTASAHSVWDLSGPRSLVRDVLEQVESNRRHVQVVLPRALAGVEFLDGLEAALFTGLADRFEVGRVTHSANRPLAEAIAEGLLADQSPTSMVDLAHAEDVAGKVALVTAERVDLAEPMNASSELGALVAATRSLPRDSHPLVVYIGGHTQRPSVRGGSRSETNLAVVWWWGRIQRWDTAAVVANSLSPGSGRLGLLDLARLETIVDLVGWDLGSVPSLANRWDGDPTTLADLIAEAEDVLDVAALDEIGPDSFAPPDRAIEAWDRGQVDLWQGYLRQNVSTVGARRLQTTVWGAQARVYLPWIEERRARLEAILFAHAGAKTFRRGLADLNLNPADPLEIGKLELLFAHIAPSHRVLMSSARALKRARNCLSHLLPLSLIEQRALVAAGKQVGSG